jgi:phosphogluconate dehydratase
MLSAHQPFSVIRTDSRSRARGGRDSASCRWSAGVCDGVTQGRPGMELSLFSRDVIALSAAIALSHDMFGATLFLGVCDRSCRAC